ncbi:hypothetical protein RRG08_052863 [Elysia crispata]|uniref:Uncharacterized protein n=1 Tax=Elysia crispata TaxID=231223 RepID=A0AAE1CLV8_9GAST|nr:hypothetical protein RRG08_052863 [Elysia crispata]
MFPKAWHPSRAMLKQISSGEKVTATVPAAARSYAWSTGSPGWTVWSFHSQAPASQESSHFFLAQLTVLIF